VPYGDPRFEAVKSLEDVAEHWLREIENFFATYKYLQDIQTDLRGWDDRDAAWRAIDEARDAYRRALELPRF
jgi:inorganic pyrophosphatase